MRSGQTLTHTALFNAPADGVAVLTWTLTDETGAAVDDGTLTPPEGAVSADILISALNNTLGVGVMWGGREIYWTFNAQVGAVPYDLEGRIPFGVSAEGVRVKLGLEELTDAEIPLMKAYLTFREKVGSVALAAITADLDKLIVADAIEASAALNLIPTLQVRVAQKESSGTNQYTRFKVDWDFLAGAMLKLVADGETLVDATLAPANNDVSLLQLATPDTDLFPGA